MKKIILLLNIINIIISTIYTINSCNINTNNNQNHENNEISQWETSNNAKILNDIVNEINKYFVEYSNTNLFINSNQYSNNMNIFYNTINKNNFIFRLNNSNNKNNYAFEEGNKIIINQFKQYFYKINKKIKQKYSNIYLNYEPLELNDKKIENIIKFIDIKKLNTINPIIDITNLKTISYELKIFYLVNYKDLIRQNYFIINHIITNNIEKMRKLQISTTAELMKIIIKYFQNKKIIIDQPNNSFIQLYNNFDINYSRSHKCIDNIIQNELIKEIKKNEKLKKIENLIQWDSNQSIITLQTSALNDVTSGATVIVDKKNTAYVWAGIGPFNYQKIQPIIFYNFLIKLLTVFDISDNILQLANFYVNLGKINIAGIPLNNILQNNKILNIIIGISKNKLKEKLMNYSTIVINFFKMYKIKIYDNKQIFHVSDKLFNKIKSTIYYDESLKVILQDFISQNEIKNLPDIKLFNIGIYWGKNKNRWLLKNKNLLKKTEGIAYSFSFMFGGGTFDNSISYSPWSNFYFPHFYIKKQ